MKRILALALLMTAALSQAVEINCSYNDMASDGGAASLSLSKKHNGNYSVKVTSEYYSWENGPQKLSFALDNAYCSFLRENEYIFECSQDNLMIESAIAMDMYGQKALRIDVVHYEQSEDDTDLTEKFRLKKTDREGCTITK